MVRMEAGQFRSAEEGIAHIVEMKVEMPSELVRTCVRKFCRTNKFTSL